MEDPLIEELPAADEPAILSEAKTQNEPAILSEAKTQNEPAIQRSRRGGPSSPEGKARSSMNRLTHGCRSEKTVLPEEKGEEFEALLQDWLDQYNPGTPASLTLVQQTVRAQWFLRRAEKQLEDIEFHLPANGCDWNDWHHQAFEKFSRYKTTRERSFLRFFKELEAYFGRVVRDAEAQEKARARLAALEMQWVTKKQEEVLADRKVEQYVEVKLSGGRCETLYYPANKQLLQQVAERDQPPIFIKRWIRFPDGVPAEYDWSNPNELQQSSDTTGSQTMTYARWLEAIEEEKATGHLGPLQGTFV